MTGFGFLGPASSSDGIVTIQQLRMKGMSQRQETTTKAKCSVCLSNQNLWENKQINPWKKKKIKHKTTWSIKKTIKQV